MGGLMGRMAASRSSGKKQGGKKHGVVGGQTDRQTGSHLLEGIELRAIERRARAKRSEQLVARHGGVDRRQPREARAASEVEVEEPPQPPQAAEDAVDGGARGGLGEEVGGVGQRVDQRVHVQREDGRGGANQLRRRRLEEQLCRHQPKGRAIDGHAEQRAAQPKWRHGVPSPLSPLLPLLPVGDAHASASEQQAAEVGEVEVEVADRGGVVQAERWRGGARIGEQHGLGAQQRGVAPLIRREVGHDALHAQRLGQQLDGSDQAVELRAQCVG